MLKNWRLVCYDVRDPARLRKVAKIIKGFGVRVQYSTFCCFLSERETEFLRYELKKILKQEDDLLIIPLCDRCVSKIRSTHVTKVWPDDPEQYSIVY